MRATASAISLLAVILFGNGLGPLLVGLASDLMAWMGYDAGSALRAALTITTVPVLCAAILFLSAARHLKADLGEI
ncbi:MFS transporter permease [Sphingobium indicum]|uniref:MFS transporter permease n=3 Tax=Sphingobium indicum TaxID=332055 RepID=A0A8E0WQI2_9SPHN|nr:MULTISPECIES: hypothetical protein [Sphingobium]EPR14704.1 hypothetical protein M527_27970 [Sphingobium indicum IP26]KEY99914.1 MFS transporter permease [Sphingomonas sp. BHC-A]APL95404.1 MFS transporter permease [Sphingobium indicum B90A]EQA97767.1 hypothetical protein L286_22010 [Sphingobium sp. HDIP04]KER35561.1 MFS transporter permease [Sphingobium indicum F2]